MSSERAFGDSSKQIKQKKNPLIFAKLKCFQHIFTISSTLLWLIAGGAFFIKLKQSEIEAKMIIKMKRHNLCPNWQIIFMSDTDKRRHLLIFLRS